MIFMDLYEFPFVNLNNRELLDYFFSMNYERDFFLRVRVVLF